MENEHELIQVQYDLPAHEGLLHTYLDRDWEIFINITSFKKHLTQKFTCQMFSYTEKS